MTKARKSPSGIHSRWQTFWAVCHAPGCGRKWQAVLPMVHEIGTVECPSCHNPSGGLDPDRVMTPGELARAMDFATEIEANRKRVKLASN